MTTPDIIELCRECAREVYGTRPPTAQYAAHAADLLIGTAATESLFKYRRQTVFDWKRDIGAWGLWQTERGSVIDGCKMLRERPALAKNAARFLFQQEDADMEPILAMSASDLLRLISGWDRAAVLFARLHYFRVATAIPATHEGRAAYYKHWYNTIHGKGSVAKYLADYRRLVIPHLN